MNTWSPSNRLAIVAVLGLTTGACLPAFRDLSTGITREAHAQQPDANDSVWEYKTSSIDAASLQTHLTSLGSDGWEAFSITTTDAIVDTGPDGKPHLTTQRFEVTARRKARR